MEIKISNKLVEQIGDIFSKQLGEQFVDINLQFCLNFLYIISNCSFICS
ncbi:hypothetical protein PFNF54_04429 [Plasmodium falciparum NF54]|uniref:Uncharacterized protein n=1 Tax=Plasmodium falciparum (isolate NF54) TaxID=5843 RepID=W7JQ44_PLAFO|nr:hypothetical protein PFNF54_04429 [Plasmodium falciparum NF54]